MVFGLLADLAAIAEITVSSVASLQNQKPDDRGCSQMLRLSMRTLRFVWSSGGGPSDWSGMGRTALVGIARRLRLYRAQPWLPAVAGPALADELLAAALDLSETYTMAKAASLSSVEIEDSIRSSLGCIASALLAVSRGLLPRNTEHEMLDWLQPPNGALCMRALEARSAERKNGAANAAAWDSQMSQTVAQVGEWEADRAMREMSTVKALGEQWQAQWAEFRARELGRRGALHRAISRKNALLTHEWKRVCGVRWLCVCVCGCADRFELSFRSKKMPSV
jgi:hypothetical protein